MTYKDIMLCKLYMWLYITFTQHVPMIAIIAIWKHSTFLYLWTRRVPITDTYHCFFEKHICPLPNQIIFWTEAIYKHHLLYLKQ